MFKSKRNRFYFAVLFLFTGGFFPVQAPAFGVRGSQAGCYRFVPTASVLSYQNAGYTIHSAPDGTIRVKVNLSPLRNATRYPTKIRNPRAKKILDSIGETPLSPLLATTVQELVQPCHGYYQAVTAILDWVTRHFHYRPQKTGTPLEGDCTAAAKLTVQMLLEAGIPARTAIGVVVGRNRVILSGKALHSFVEIYYPGIGWLFSDPLSSYHFIPANYVLLRGMSLTDYFGLTLVPVCKIPPFNPVDTGDQSPIPARINLFRFN